MNGSGPTPPATASSTELTCTLPGGKSGTYNGVYGDDDLKIIVHVDGNDAAFSGTLKIALELTEVTPNTGSAKGGTLLTLKGTGFSQNMTSNTILLGSDTAICTIESVTISATEGESIITCRTPAKPSDWTGEQTVAVLGRI